MKAILLNQAGGVENFLFQEIDKPILKNGEVLVKIKAIGINPADAGMRRNEEMITRWVGLERPAILGWDISGEIVEKEEDTNGFEKGDKVFGFTENGRGYAEYVAVPVRILAHKPSNITHEEAAAFPIAGLTGCQPLVHLGHIKKGDKVVIHAGSGGVGHYAIQVAKYLGAQVIATSSGANRDFIMSLGADRHIDYTVEKFYEKIDAVDFVLDTIGGETLSHSIDIVKEGGMVVTVIPPLTDDISNKAGKRNVQLSLWMVRTSGDDLRYFADLFSKGLLRSHISAVYPFARMGEAHKQMETGRTVGKVVVTL